MSRELREVALRLRRTDGSPPEKSPLVQVLHQGRILESHGFGRYSDGVVRCVLLPGAFDVWILVPGHVPVLLRRVDGDRDVLLTPSATALSVRVDGVSRLPAGVGARVLVTSQAEVPAGWDLPEITADPWGKASVFSPVFRLERDWPGRVSSVLTSDGTARLAIQRPGQQDLAVELFEHPARAGSSLRETRARVAGMKPVRIDLAPGAAQTVRIQVSLEGLAEALRSMGR